MVSLGIFVFSVVFVDKRITDNHEFIKDWNDSLSCLYSWNVFCIFRFKKSLMESILDYADANLLSSNLLLRHHHCHGIIIIIFVAKELLQHHC